MNVTTSPPALGAIKGTVRVHGDKFSTVAFVGTKADVLDQIVALQFALDDAAAEVDLWSEDPA